MHLLYYILVVFLHGRITLHNCTLLRDIDSVGVRHLVIAVLTLEYSSQCTRRASYGKSDDDDDAPP